MFQRVTIPESDVYHLLSNERRREALTVLWEFDDELTLRVLSEQIASIESEMTPAPRPLRESVYNALHQTHLPKLATYGLVEYDPDRKLVRSNPQSRSLARYMDTVTPVGVSWGEYYRALGIVALFAVVASLTSLPLFSAVDPLIIASAALAVFALSTVYQLSGSLTRSLRSVPALLKQYLP
ncbi:DUF7344 domain-containing protein [Halorientalis salina]|uniref:DUF7344 domain-containing protein n=1 Tax=Halorientalis salina TaxID=2932266 RepID=UPI0010ACCE52|nr:hypothetical protein [Halorientalis salina]